MVKISGIIEAKGVNIHAKLSSDNNDYLSLTDIARYRDDENPGYIIQNWLRNRNTLAFLGAGSRSTTQRSIALHLMISWTRPD